MRKTRKLLAAGLLPLAAGYVCNYLMLLLPLPGVFFFSLSFVFVLLWGYLAYRLADPKQNAFVQSGMMCVFGVFMLALVLYQELVLGQYWLNLVGTGTQMYFLPLLSATSTVFSPIISLLMPVMRIWPFYVCELLSMFVISVIGCWLKKRKLYT